MVFAEGDEEVEEEEERPNPKPGVRNADDRSGRGSSSGNFSGGGSSFPSFKGQDPYDPTGWNGTFTGSPYDPSGGSSSGTINDPINGDNSNGLDPDVTNGKDPEGHRNDSNLHPNDPSGESNDPTDNSNDPDGRTTGSKNDSTNPEGNSTPTEESSDPNSAERNLSEVEGSDRDDERGSEGDSSGQLSKDELEQALEEAEGEELIQLVEEYLKDIAAADSLYGINLKDLASADLLLLALRKHPLMEDPETQKVVTELLEKYIDAREIFSKSEPAQSLTFSRLMTPFAWLDNKVRGAFAVGGEWAAQGVSTFVTHLDRTMQLAGRGANSLMDVANGLVSNRYQDIQSSQEVARLLATTSDSKMGSMFFSGMEKMYGAQAGILRATQGSLAFMQRGAQLMEKSTIASFVSNATNATKNFATSAIQNGKNLVSKAWNSTPMEWAKKFVNTPLGKLAGTGLNGISVYTGFMDMTSDKATHAKIGGALNMTSGLLALGAMGAVAIPPLATGLAVASVVVGIGSLAFTYAPVIRDKWNESKVGSFVNSKVSEGMERMGEGLKSAREAGGRLLTNISTGISGLFGRG